MTISEAIMMATKKKFHRTIIECDFQVAVNAIYGKIPVSRNIVNLIKDVRNICTFFKEVNVSYRSVIGRQIE